MYAIRVVFFLSGLCLGKAVSKNEMKSLFFHHLLSARKVESQHYITRTKNGEEISFCFNHHKIQKSGELIFLKGDCQNPKVSFELPEVQMLEVIEDEEFLKLNLTFLKKKNYRTLRETWTFPMSEKWPSLRLQSLEQGKNVFSPENGEFCHLLDEECKDITPNRCSACLGGWYEVPGGSCKIKKSKKCGINNCGKRGEVACLKGMGNIPSCPESTEQGFCQAGLSPQCQGNEIICF